jgi:hypothetical protein
MVTAKDAAVSKWKFFSPCVEIAKEGIFRIVPSIAAETVPE